MWEKHVKCTGLASATGRTVTMSRDGKLTVSSTLMDELGRPASVDIYVDRDEGRIGLTPGPSYQVVRANDSACVGTVSTTGTLNAMRMDADVRVRHPRFEVATHDGQPMLVVWPLIPADDEEVRTAPGTSGGRDCPTPRGPEHSREAVVAA